MVVESVAEALVDVEEGESWFMGSDCPARQPEALIEARLDSGGQGFTLISNHAGSIG